MSDEWQIEMLWRCTACAHRNLGRHLSCQRCGKPKTGAEEYEMPSDTSEANAVRDAELQRVATAGANWRCRFCGSDQRRFDGACAQCGAAQREGRDLGASPASPPRVVPAPLPSPARRAINTGTLVAILAVVVALFMCSGGMFMVVLVRGTGGPAPPAVTAPAYHDVSAIVARVAWEHAIQVERYQLVAHEGFAENKPADAVDARVVGQHVHHTDKVPDGFSTETYTETVPDGTRTETYTASEACGQTCTTRPESCRQQCKPNKNGFATCKNVCTGGGQDCRTKTCSRTKTRQVPKTKTVTKTRQVPRFRDVPRNADWWSWRSWEWARDRVVSERGDTLETRWPAPEKVKLGDGGQREREHRSATYEVQLAGDAGRDAASDAGSWVIHPASIEELGRFAIGSTHALRVWNDGRVQCVDDEAGDAGAR